MAAHPFTMLKEMSQRLGERPTVDECKIIAGAMMGTQQADYIFEGLDIYYLAANVYPETLKRFIDATLPKYEAAWRMLGEPRNWEEWRARVSELKTRALGKYRKIVYEFYPSMWSFMTDEEKSAFRHVPSKEFLGW